MRIGICTGIDNIQKVQDMGFDYLEVSATAISGMSERDFAQAVEKVENSKIKCEAFNILFPKNFKLVGSETDESTIREYIAATLERVHKLGGEIVVFGSGGARKCPEGWEFEKAWKQILEAAKMVGDEAAKYDITVVIEPLNKGETNTINSVADGLKLVKELNHPNVKLLADFFHMRVEKEEMDIIEETGELLKHTHIANGNGRTYPLTENEDDYQNFFKSLKNVGYEGRISIEGKTNQFDIDAPKGLQLLRELEAI
jgi:D-psicose/D-tagatose/L-ribulose 3-epimerase